METLKRAYAGKRVFVTGHTGFKGSWLCEWLLLLGAEVWGYSLPPPTKPALFDQLGLARRVRHRIGDVRDAGALSRALKAARPDFAFHLAAQPLVRASYDAPAATWDTNVGGTVNFLEALRGVSRPCAAVVVTTDKVYAPSKGGRPHREEGALGGEDPYGASKAAADIAVQAWRSGYFSDARKVALASARAGNVIGGGDWARDRLVPDCMRALAAGAPIEIRQPRAIRPWQHVLDPLHGYLLLGLRLRRGGARFAAPFNFGPAPRDHRTVGELVDELLRRRPGSWRRVPAPRNKPESPCLRLDASRASRQLGWRPRWNFRAAVARTADWYEEVARGGSPAGLTRAQIAAFSAP